MFRELGQIASLIKAAPKIKEEMGKLQTRLGQLTAEADAGGGMVKVKVNGRMEIVSCTLTDDAFKMNDRELLEDLIKGAANRAMEKARELVAEETGKIAQSLGLGGMPDLSSLGGS